MNFSLQSVILSLSKDQPPENVRVLEKPRYWPFASVTSRIFRKLILRQAQDDGKFETEVAP
jgi:hypothetical protein